MKEKINDIFCPMLNAVIIAGVIILIIGLYYSVIKAGIPYQDPPLNLQIQYEVNARIGNILVKNGFQIMVCSSIIRGGLHLIWKQSRKK